MATVATAEESRCDACELCVPGGDGFAFCYDGNMVVIGGVPATGGPWIPGVTANGQVVWINGGGL